MNNNRRFQIVNDGGMLRIKGKFYGSLGAARSALSNVLYNHSWDFEKARFNPEDVIISEYELVLRTSHPYKVSK